MEKILVIDDDDLIRKVLDEILTLQGYNVTVARDGIEGIELLNNEASFGLVITDIRMPGADGNQVAEHVKSNEKMKKTPIIGITGYPNEIKGKLFNSILIKPFRNDEFVALIDSLI